MKMLKDDDDGIDGGGYEKKKRGNIPFLSALPNPPHNIEEDEEDEDKASGRQNLFATRLLDAEQCQRRHRHRHRRH